MKLIIGDIGNTISKICIVDDLNFKITKVFNLETKKIISSQYLKKIFVKNKILKGKKKILNKALFSSVKPSVYFILKKFLKKNYFIKTFEIKDKTIHQIVKINTKKPQQVGSDRIANASGAHKIYKSNCIIVDFGTATTFDVVMKEGIYNGGVIAPGIELSLNSLSQATAKLPLIKVNPTKKIIGKNTIEAMNSGFFWGYSGLIANIIDKIKLETKKNYKIIFTGGLASLFAKSLNSKILVNTDITIKGILEIYKKNKSNI